jgi:hypothetical protein
MILHHLRLCVSNITGYFEAIQYLLQNFDADTLNVNKKVNIEQ